MDIFFDITHFDICDISKIDSGTPNFFRQIIFLQRVGTILTLQVIRWKNFVTKKLRRIAN